jgi:hypothetical protein
MILEQIANIISGHSLYSEEKQRQRQKRKRLVFEMSNDEQRAMTAMPKRAESSLVRAETVMSRPGSSHKPAKTTALVDLTALDQNMSRRIQDGLRRTEKGHGSTRTFIVVLLMMMMMMMMRTQLAFYALCIVFDV